MVRDHLEYWGGDPELAGRLVDQYRDQRQGGGQRTLGPLALALDHFVLEAA